MQQIVEIVDPKKEDTVTFDINKVVDMGNNGSNIQVTEKKKRGPGRPPKNSQPVLYTDIVTADNTNSQKKKDSYETALEQKYGPTTGILVQAIGQADYIFGKVEEELDKYRDNRSFGGKTRNLNLTNLLNTQASIINTKINAVRELNSVRHKMNDLMLKKEQMMKDTREENSDKAVMDSYYALINASSYGLPTMNPPLSQSSINTGVNLSNNPIPVSDISGIVTPTVGSMPIVENNYSGNPQQSYINPNLDPVQRRMILEHNPAVKTVVVYDQSTGNKSFAVLNVSSGEIIHNAQTPAAFLLDDMKIDYINGVARNSNANMTFPLVIVGNRAIDEL